MNARSRQKSVLSMLVVTLMVLGTVAAVVIFAAPHASAAPAGVNSSVPTLAGAAPPPPATPTQVLCTNPTTFGIGTPTVTYGYSGGNAPCTTANIFAPGGNTVSFWLSTTTASTGIVGSAIGTAVLSAGSGNLDNTFTLTIPAGTAAGGYYLLANTNTVPTSYQYGGAIVVAAQPSFSLSPTTASPQMQVGEAGSGWDASALIHVTISYADAPYAMPTGVGFTAAPTPLGSVTTTLAGNFPLTQLSAVLPALAAGTYTIVAQEVSTGVNFPLSLITADATLTIQGAVGTCYSSGFPGYETCNAGPVAPLGMVASTSGTATLVHQPYLTGGGFAAGASITSITVGGVAATFTPATATVAADGSFTVQITALASTIQTQGPATIVVVTSPASTPSAFPDAIVVSNPGVSTNLIATDTSTSASSGASGDGLMYQGWGFAASTGGNVYFDGVARAETSDANGYFLDQLASVPSLPSGAYNVFADFGGYTAATTFTIGAYNGIFDSGASPLTGEYAVAGSQVELYAQSLAPIQQLDVIDTGLISEFGTSSLDTACAVYAFCPILNFGSFNANTGAIQATAVGMVDIFYNLFYGGLPTGSAQTITLVTLPSGSTVTTATYYAVGGAVTTLATSYSPTGTVSLSISGLIPNGSAITPETAGYIGPFTITLDGSPVTFSSPVAGSELFWSTATGTASVVFANIATNPVEELDIGVGVTLLYQNFDFISSTPSVSSGTVAPNGVEQSALFGSGTSGSPWVFYADPAGLVWGVVFDLYDFPASTAVTVTIWTSAGATTVAMTTDANGAGLYAFAPPNTAGVISPPGSPEYLLTFSAASTITITGGTYYWELETAVAFNAAPFADTGGIPALDYAGYFGADSSIGGAVTVYVSNYLPNSPLNLVMTQSPTAPLAGSGITDTNLVAQATTDANGDATFTFTVPPSMTGITMTGTWYLYVVENTFNTGHGPFNINTVGLTIEFPDFNLFDGGISNVPAAAGFPGEIVTFDWVPATLPAAGVPVSVTIELNGSAYTTMPATFTGTDVIGSFTMPNDDAGSSWVVSLMWTQVADSGGNTVVSSYGSASSAPLALVNGAGALVVSVSITQAQIVQIATLSGQFVNLTLASLGAQITSINGTLASLSTQFGDMTATLAAIGASVTSVENGIATITTQVGTITASLTQIDAQIVALNQTVSALNTTSITHALAELQTSIGDINITLGAIDATVTSTATSVNGLVGSVATITTTLGTITGQITSVTNGIATIQTSLGTLQTSVNAIGQPSGGVASQNSVNTTMYLLYVVIVLAIIAIIVAAMAMMRAGRGGSGGSRTPPAEYQGPTSTSSTPPKSGSSGGSSGSP